MSYSGIEPFVRDLRRHGELIEINEKVSPRLEISEITDRVAKQKDGGKALLFKNTGTSFPVLINALGSLKRIEIAFGGRDPEALADAMSILTRDLSSPHHGLAGKLKFLPQLKRISSWMPRKIYKRGKCQEIVLNDPALESLPVLTCWPHDGGPFITLPLVHTVDPATGSRNLGMYRMQVFDSLSAGMHWHMHKTGARHYREYKKRGLKMPVAVALGGDPVYTYCATAPLPDGIDEYLLAGYIRRKPVRLVKCLTQEMWVPEDADIIIEGYVDPAEELAMEGPFGDHTGFYSLADYYPTFHVTCISHRKNAVYPATIVGIPPQEDAWIALATEKLFLPPIKMSMIPELVDMHMPEAGVAHNLAFFSIKTDYPGQGRKVLNSLWGAGQMMFNKYAVVTGDSSGIRDYLSLAADVCSRIDPAKNLFFSEGPLDVLDHAARTFALGGKLGFDATGPVIHKDTAKEKDVTGPLASFRSVCPEVTSVNHSLPGHGIPLLIIAFRKSKPGHARELAKELAQFPGLGKISFYIIVDHNINTKDLHMVAWITGNHTDPSVDAWVIQPDNAGSHGKLFIDATRKTMKYDGFSRDWPNPVLMDKETIEKIDRLWGNLEIGPLIPSPSNYYRVLEEKGNAVAEENI